MVGLPSSHRVTAILANSRRRAALGLTATVRLAVALGLGLALGLTACRPSGPAVVVYAAQDRVFAEPVFREYTRRTGTDIRAVHDNEAVKTTGLANRLMAEAARPLADLWWSNEEMRTRQLARKGVLEPGWRTFGHRRRVFVVNSNQAGQVPMPSSLLELTNPAYRGRIALAYPVFGTTATHLLVLRQRWGTSTWEAWCRALAANRPILVDGNSVVVRMVARGDVELGLTDSDDVAFGRREGLPVSAVPLAPGDGLVIPNTLARVTGSTRTAWLPPLEEYLAGREVRDALVKVGALDPGPPPEEPGLDEAGWDRVIEELDTGLRWLESSFVR